MVPALKVSFAAGPLEAYTLVVISTDPMFSHASLWHDQSSPAWISSHAQSLCPLVHIFPASLSEMVRTRVAYWVEVLSEQVV